MKTFLKNLFVQAALLTVPSSALPAGPAARICRNLHGSFPVEGSPSVIEAVCVNDRLIKNPHLEMPTVAVHQLFSTGQPNQRILEKLKRTTNQNLNHHENHALSVQ
jgi:hypothetical protein